MTDVTEHTTPVYPMARTCPMSPPLEYAKLRERGPVSRARLPDGRPVWLVTGHAETRAVLADPRVSSDRTAPGYPSPFVVTRELVKQGGPSMVGQDPPEHGRTRRPTITEFSVKRVRELRPRIQEIVDEHISALLAGPRPADLVPALSLPVPSLVICELLGVPYADRALFQSRTALMISNSTPPERRLAASQEILDYFDVLITAKETRGDDDVLGRVMARHRAEGTYDHRAAVQLARLLLIAGHETTANMISLGTVALLEHPEQRAELVADPELVPQAVEELLRFFTIADTVTIRTARADIEIGGVTIREGEGLVALGAAADHDPVVFADPGTLDIHRDARHHVAFGYGIHQCLGQNLARAELEIVFGTLFRRIPGLRLAAPVEELAFKTDAVVYGMHALPVTW
ncbi:MAG: cytochrome P450 [Streptosporangiales bacterium]|nr:cytochrome P450 [Streptosporangiales bacterium]